MEKNLLMFLFLFLIQVSYANAIFEGQIEPVPSNIQQLMITNTWYKDCPVKLKDLALLKMTYWGFDNKVHIGEMIVNQQLATEVLTIFNQLFQVHFPIEKMIIPEKLIGHKKFSNSMDLLFYIVNADDTYGFFCRADTQTRGKFSPHSWGTAMDINPYYNPALISIKNSLKQAGYKYINRKLQHIGMIRANSPIFYIFLNHGWRWGGFFPEGVDYMHFQKGVFSYYKINQLIYNPPSKRIPGLPVWR